MYENYFDWALFAEMVNVGEGDKGNYREGNSRVKDIYFKIFFFANVILFHLFFYFIFFKKYQDKLI